MEGYIQPISNMNYTLCPCAGQGPSGPAYPSIVPRRANLSPAVLKQLHFEANPALEAFKWLGFNEPPDQGGQPKLYRRGNLACGQRQTGFRPNPDRAPHAGDGEVASADGIYFVVLVATVNVGPDPKYSLSAGHDLLQPLQFSGLNVIAGAREPYATVWSCLRWSSSSEPNCSPPRS
jgi:hypothetical protein